MLFLVLLAILHPLKPEFDPLWRFVSEYEIGDFGWLMRLGFLALSLSSFAAAIALRPELSMKSGKIGLALLFLSSAILLITAIVAPDPITTSVEDATVQGNLHSMASMLAGLLFSAAALLITRDLSRNSAWDKARAGLFWLAQLSWISLVLMYATLFIMLPQNDGKFGPEVWIGWPTRLVVVSIALWDIAAAWSAINLGKP